MTYPNGEQNAKGKEYKLNEIKKKNNILNRIYNNKVQTLQVSNNISTWSCTTDEI